MLHCDLLAMATPVRKAFTTDVGQMLQRRRQMTTHSLQLSSLKLIPMIHRRLNLVGEAEVFYVIASAQICVLVSVF